MHDEVDAIVSDNPDYAMLRARIRATLALRDYTTTALIAETERLYMALDWIALYACEKVIRDKARATLDPPVRLAR